MAENTNPNLDNNASVQRHGGQWYNRALVLPAGTLPAVYSTDAQQADLIIEVEEDGSLSVIKDRFGFILGGGA